MKSRISALNRLLYLLLIALLASTVNAQEKSVPVEPSEERLNNQHKPEQLIEVMGLKEGMVIADIGAGRGRMAVWFAAKVGDTGKVYANDINKNVLEYLENRCRKNNISNVVTVLGKSDDPLLPEGEVDMAFMVSTYHHLTNPIELMRNTIPCLKKDGIMIIVERDPAKTGMSERESTSKGRLTKELNEAGYKLVKVNSILLERDNIYFFKVK